MDRKTKRKRKERTQKKSMVRGRGALSDGWAAEEVPPLRNPPPPHSLPRSPGRTPARSLAAAAAHPQGTLPLPPGQAQPESLESSEQVQEVQTGQEGQPGRAAHRAQRVLEVPQECEVKALEVCQAQVTQQVQVLQQQV